MGKQSYSSFILGRVGDSRASKLSLQFALLVLCWLTGSAQAASISPRARSSDGVELHLEGEIQQGDEERLEANFEKAKGSGLNVTGISLNSPGGKVAAGAAMARSIRSRGLLTMVGDNATCASACFMLFAAGKERVASESARIGVHSAVTPMVGETETAKSTTIDSARFLSELGVPATVLGKMVTAKPTEMAWLTKEDLRLMRVNTAADKKIPGSYVETATPQIRRDALPPAVKPADVQTASDLLIKAQSQIRADAAQGAAETLKQALTLDPYDPLIASTYGYALHLLGQNKEAREALLLALQIRKDYAEAHRVLGLVSASIGDSLAARNNFYAYYKKSSRPDLAFSYLSDLAKSERYNSAAALAARAAIDQINTRQ